MVFSSLEFLFFFLPAFLVLYYLLPLRFRTGFLLLGGLVFYWYGTKSTPFYLILFLLAALFTWLWGLLLVRQKSRAVLAVGILLHLGLLVFYKYAGFLLSLFGISFTAPPLPLGLSFTTFMHIAYLVDVYRADISAEPSPLRYGAFSAFFPKVTSGPITGYGEVASSLSRPAVSMATLDEGLREFIAGLGYKVLLADRVGGLWNELSMIGYDSISTPLAWLGAVAFSLQLYFDFYGYSRMAIGLGRMLGFTLPENFRFPYVARSMTDFWRRWHITLGAWFRRYLYIPLGGNRCSPLRHTGNLFAVWFLTGLWHGASWNFVLWGLLLFLCIFIEKKLTLSFLSGNGFWSRLISHSYMILLIPIQWVLFAIPSLPDLFSYLGRLFFLGGAAVDPTDFLRYLSDFGILLAVGLLFATPLPHKLFSRIRDSLAGTLVLFGVFALSVYYISLGSNNPFMYFNF